MGHQEPRPNYPAWGDYGDRRLDVVNNELQLNGDPIVSGVVTMRAQYGVSEMADDNEVTAWVPATGIWAQSTITMENRNRIKAVRVAIVLRNGLKERENVTTLAPVAYTDSGTTAFSIDVSFLTDWQKYRYRVFTTTVPLRNMIWSREAM